MRCYCYLHFADEETKAHIRYSDGGYTVSKWQNWDYKPRQLVLETVLLTLIVLPPLRPLSKQVCVLLLNVTKWVLLRHCLSPAIFKAVVV